MIYKFIENREIKGQEHRLIVIWGLSNAILMVIFVNWTTWWGEFLTLAFLGGGHYGTLTVSNICVLSLSQKKAGVWIILVNALFGVGALIAPQIIRFLSL